MKSYVFHSANGPVVVKDDELVIPAQFRGKHWRKADVAAVSIEGLTKVDVEGVATYGVEGEHAKHPAVTITKADGTRREYQFVTESAAELANTPR